MDNYKIKVKDEAESKEAQELFFELGYSNRQSKRFGFVYTQDGVIGCDSMEHWDYYNDLCQELTLPQLRDLVVLKRNDVKDATHTNLDNGLYFLSSDNVIYRWEEKWVRSILNDSEDYNLIIQHGLNPIEKPKTSYLVNYKMKNEFVATNPCKPIDYSTLVMGGKDTFIKPQDPALISGDVALDALKAKKEVEYCGEGINDSWLSAETLPVVYFLTDSFKFRLKPTTLKVNAELPKPSKEFQQNTEVFAVTYEFKTREERDAFADKLRGTNS